MKKTTKSIKLNLILVLIVSMFIATLTGCGNSGKVVHPVEILDSSTEEIQEEPETEETTEEEGDVPAENEEFILLEAEESETSADDSGNVVTQDGKIVIDLVFFMGQSNMSGAGGDASLAPQVPEGHGYEFRTISDPTRLYPIEEPFGKNESFIGGICDLPGAKKGSLVSTFAEEYYRLTGVPIVGVSASQGASTTEIWQSPGFQADMKERYQRAVVWLEASGYYIRNRYAVWFQGESDAANHVNPDVYNTNMDNIIRPLFISGLNKVFIITPGRTLSIKYYFADIIQEQLDMCKESGYYALGTNVLTAVSAEHMVDEWHYDQQTLNLLGIETARSVACYTLNRRERIDYDYLNNKTYIPNLFGYSGEEKCEPLNVSNISKLLDDDEYRYNYHEAEFTIISEDEEEPVYEEEVQENCEENSEENAE